MFRPATLRQIVNRMTFRVTGRNISLTDLTKISTFRIIMESFAEEFLGLHGALAREQSQWFLNSASGENLDRRLADYGVARPGPFYASGEVTITSLKTAPATFRPGDVARTEPLDGSAAKRYQIKPNPDDPNGWWTGVNVGGKLPILALTAGGAGNTPSGTITVIDGIGAGCTNNVPLSNGRERASDQEARDYFRAWLQGLPRSTRAAMRAAILGYQDPTMLDYPVASVAFEEWNGQVLLSGSTAAIALRIYIADGTGTAPAALLTAVQNLVNGTDVEGSGLRSAGVPAEVVSASPLPIAVSCALDVDPTFNAATVERQVDQVIRQFIGAVPIAGVTISGHLDGQFNFSRFFRAIMDVPGVLRARFDDPVGDRPIPVGAKAVAGNIRVSAATVPT